MNDVMIEAQPLIIGGHQDSEDLLHLDLSVSLATGIEFLGRCPVPERRRIAFFSGEGAGDR